MTRQVRATQAVAGEPRPAKLDAPGHALLVDDGAVAGGRGKFGDADVVAVIEGRSARARVIEGLSGRRGREGAEELIGGSRVVGESVQVVGRHVERPGGRGELVERPAGLAALDHRDRLSGVDGVGGELPLGDGAQGAGVAQTLSDETHLNIVIRIYS